MLSIVDAADAAVQLQGGSALAVAAVNAARHGGSSIVVSAASVSPSGGGERKRVRRSEFPGMDDAAYRSMMQQRRQQQEKQRDRGRDRTERLYPAREQQRQKEQEYPVPRWLAEAASNIARSFDASTSPGTSPGLDQHVDSRGAFAGDGSATAGESRCVVVAPAEARLCRWQHVDHHCRDRSPLRTRT